MWQLLEGEKIYTKHAVHVLSAFHRFSLEFRFELIISL